MKAASIATPAQRTNISYNCETHRSKNDYFLRPVTRNRRSGSPGGATASRRHSPRSTISFCLARLAKVIFHFLPGLSFLVRGQFDTQARVQEIHTPIFIVHCHQDPVLPFTFGQEVYAASNPPKTFLEDQRKLSRRSFDHRSREISRSSAKFSQWRGKTIDTQRAKFIGSSFASDPVGFLSLFESRSAAPRSNFRVISADQHIWHFPSAIFRRPRVMRKIQELSVGLDVEVPHPGFLRVGVLTWDRPDVSASEVS